jgi:hypothetical protein
MLTQEANEVQTNFNNVQNPLKEIMKIQMQLKQLRQ